MIWTGFAADDLTARLLWLALCCWADGLLQWLALCC
jgi:hypothetical protein